MGCKAAFMLMLVLLLPTLASAQQGPDALGEWQTPSGAIVRVAPCGYDTALLCGQVMRAPPPGAAGQPVLTGLAPAGPGRWQGGQIRPVGATQVFPARIRISDGALVVEACAGLSCRGEHWVRAKSPD